MPDKFTIKIVTEADTAGARAGGQALIEMGEKGRSAFGQIKEAAEEAGVSHEKLRGAARILGHEFGEIGHSIHYLLSPELLTLFGGVAIIEKLIEKVKEWKEQTEAAAASIAASFDAVNKRALSVSETTLKSQEAFDKWQASAVKSAETVGQAYDDTTAKLKILEGLEEKMAKAQGKSAADIEKQKEKAKDKEDAALQTAAAAAAAKLNPAQAAAVSAQGRSAEADSAATAFGDSYATRRKNAEDQAKVRGPRLLELIGDARAQMEKNPSDFTRAQYEAQVSNYHAVENAPGELDKEKARLEHEAAQAKEALAKAQAEAAAARKEADDLSRKASLAGFETRQRHAESFIESAPHGLEVKAGADALSRAAEARAHGEKVSAEDQKAIASLVSTLHGMGRNAGTIQAIEKYLIQSHDDFSALENVVKNLSARVDHVHTP